MRHCYLKIAYYVVLIVFYGFDVTFDWEEYLYEVREHGRFAGAPINSTAIKDALFVSCVSGSTCCVLMIGVYIYYIVFHYKCATASQETTYTRLETTAHSRRNWLLECDDDNERKSAVCNRHFVLAELVISNIELYLKDGIQSVLLIYMSLNFQNLIIVPDWRDIVFAVCSIVANLKLIACFISKLFGIGSGEKLLLEDCDSWKCLACMVGCVGAVVFEILSILYLALTLPV